MKKLMMVAAATVAAWCSWGAESISVDKVSNHYPWDGKVDCVYTLSGAAVDCTYKGVFTLSVEKDGATVSKVVTNDVTAVNGTYTNTFDCTVLFGAGYYPNGGVAVSLVKKPAGVQLWAGGPYFATCNVGATQPQESGYHFWWGDTVGYKRNSTDDGWDAVDGSVTGFLFCTNTTTTWRKSLDDMANFKLIDSTTNLVAKYDAARVHWGSPWRMPTDAEMQALIANCTTTWTNDWNGTGINGRLVTGKDAFASKNIFLPAAGYGVYFEPGGITKRGSYGYYWSSTPYYSYTIFSWFLRFGSNNPDRDFDNRYWGMPIRPVRSAE